MVPNEYRLPWAHFTQASVCNFRRRLRKIYLKTWKNIWTVRSVEQRSSDKIKPAVSNKRSKKKN
jgi:hypothetical protein